MDNSKAEYMQYNSTCADCAYYHCKRTCKNGKKCQDGECLYSGARKKCHKTRCEHFKAWKNVN